MKKITLLFLLLNTYILSNINAVVSILPQKTFLKAVGGEKVNVTIMVQPGNSPHTYEPKPSQMIQIAKADLYFTIDVKFENVWLVKFKNLNPKMKVIDLADNIIKISMASTNDKHHHERYDPHIWTSPTNVKTIAKNIYNALVEHDAINKDYYKKNLENFLATIEKTDRKIIDILSVLKCPRKFMVFHPSWGYFAKSYNLEQITIETEGKEPKPRALIYLLEKAKEEKVTAIFTQPEFSDSVAKIIANELHIPVVKVSPLAPNWSENLISIAHSISGKE